MLRRSEVPTLQAALDELITIQRKVQLEACGSIGKVADEFRLLADNIEESLGEATTKSTPGDALRSVRKRVGASLKTGSVAVGTFAQKFELACDSTSNLYDEITLDFNLLDRIVIHHFLRSGHLDVSKSLLNETEMNMLFDNRFQQLYDLLNAFRRKDVTECVRWCQAQSDSKLFLKTLFYLHRIRYLQLLEQRQIKAAIVYARSEFQSLFPTFAAGIGQLMALLIFIHSDLPSSAVTADDWISAERMFISAFCVNMGLSKQSPLLICISASQAALPSLMKIGAMRSKNSAFNIPCSVAEVSLDLDRQFQYHPTFVCPVSKIVEDQPVLLMCGHVISRTSMEKIPRVNRHPDRPFKCPYCSIEQTSSESMALQF